MWLMRLHLIVIFIVICQSELKFPIFTQLSGALQEGQKFIWTCSKEMVTRVWEEQFLGKVFLDPKSYCNAQCRRDVPGQSCCMPQPPEDIGSTFHLSIPGDAFGQGGRALSWHQVMAEPAPKSDKKIVFLMHGFSETIYDSIWLNRTRNAYFDLGHTVIVVDWRGGNQFNYIQAFSNVRTVGAMVGQVVLNWECAENTRLVGFSLGGQMVSEAARRVKTNSKSLVSECHALDPAGPYFTGCEDIVLHKDDCALTEVIHTSAELHQNMGLFAMHLGTMKKSGHCDYWINCGTFQGLLCPNVKLMDILSETMKQKSSSTWLQENICAHHRAFLVYAAQLERTCNYEIFDCQDCGQGRGSCTKGKKEPGAIPPFSSCDNSMNANFYVKSAAVSPHC